MLYNCLVVCIISTAGCIAINILSYLILNTLYVISGPGFYRLNDPTKSVKALKEDRS